MIRHRLVFELHGIARNGQLVTAQRWDGRQGYATVVIAVNGKVTQRMPGTVARCESELDRVRAALAGTEIGDDVARARLVAAGLPADDCCSSCGERLPVGCWRCAHCGLSIGRSVSGKSSAAIRRGDVTVALPPGGGP